MPSETRPEDRISVLIVEDHRVLAQGRELALGLHDDLAVGGTADSAAEAVEKAHLHDPDVVLMDFHLPDATGAEAAKRIRAATRAGHSAGNDGDPERPAIVMLSGDTSDETMLAAIEAGATAYVSKTEFATQVAEAVRKAANGDMLVDPRTLVRLLGQQRRRQEDEAERRRLRASLTKREADVLALMAQGLDTKQMAEELELTTATVRGYVQSVIEKLDAHSRLEAVATAAAHRLLDSIAGPNAGA